MESLAKTTTVNVIPTLRYNDSKAAVEWLCNVFGFVVLIVMFMCSPLARDLCAIHRRNISGRHPLFWRVKVCLWWATGIVFGCV